MAWVALGTTVASGIIGGAAAKKARKKAEKQAKKLQAKLDNLEANRQPILDPYAGATDLSGMATDYSSQFSNPYANLAVATQAAEMQMEQTDIALANTLDSLAATGGGAGGATALAREAAASKKSIAASIEQQEVANERMRAEGEARLEDKVIAEKQRIEGIEMSQAERMQNLDAQGQLFTFQQRENREQMQRDRTAAQLDNALAAANQARADQTAAFTGTIGGAASTLGTMGAANIKTGGTFWKAKGV